VFVIERGAAIVIPSPLSAGVTTTPIIPCRLRHVHYRFCRTQQPFRWPDGRLPDTV
jgi:hypothetical protein